MAQTSLPTDSDGDGLSDALEQALLVQFAPNFMVGEHDCSEIPSEFLPDALTPKVMAENGTIYGQVFPAKGSTKEAPIVEIHYYHLWRVDCGSHGHALDTEHVATLVRASGSDPATARWTAMYWYAAAHENTVCDVSQIARALTLDAVKHGPEVWISPGKHASYLDQAMCERGCGADRCEEMVPLHVNRIINLGEPNRPMNGSLFISSDRWPLAGKMATSNFPAETLARVDRLKPAEIAWFRAGRHPAQGAIAVSSTTEGALAKSAGDTTDALAKSSADTTGAVSGAKDSTGNALGKSFHKTVHALGVSARDVGKAMDPAQKSDTAGNCK